MKDDNFNSDASEFGIIEQIEAHVFSASLESQVKKIGSVKRISPKMFKHLRSM